MTQGNHPEDTQNLLRRAQQTMGGIPTLDLTNWQSPRYIPGDYQTKSLTDIPTPQGACHNIEVKTTVNGTASKCPIGVLSSIVICTGPTLGECPTDTTVACPSGGTISTQQYVNMIATFLLADAQANVPVTFKYVLNGVPKQEQVLIAGLAGPNVVYAFPANQLYPSDTSLVLYGAEVLV
jgi:hypothetical protein